MMPQERDGYLLIGRKQNAIMIVLQNESAEIVKVKAKKRNIKLENIPLLRYDNYLFTIDIADNIKRTISRVIGQLYPFIIEREVSKIWSEIKRETEEELIPKYFELLEAGVKEYNKIVW